MLHVSDKEFDKSVTQALDELPDQYVDNMKNVAIVIDDEPSTEQRRTLKLRCSETLFGLYEGIPLTQRGAGYNLVLPDKITIFKNPILSVSETIEQFHKQVKHTLWHEIAHHYGLNHTHIHEIEKRGFKT